MPVSAGLGAGAALGLTAGAAVGTGAAGDVVALNYTVLEDAKTRYTEQRNIVAGIVEELRPHAKLSGDWIGQAATGGALALAKALGLLAIIDMNIANINKILDNAKASHLTNETQGTNAIWDAFTNLGGAVGGGIGGALGGPKL